MVLGAEWFEDLPGGLNRYLANLADALTEAGVAVKALVLGPAQHAPAYIQSSGEMGAPLLRRIWALRRDALAMAAQADVLDIHFALYGLAPILSRSIHRKRIVAHFQGPWYRESRLAGQNWLAIHIKKQVETLVYRRAAAIVVLSDWNAKVLVEAFGVNPARIHRIAPGVDLSRFRPGNRQAARAEFGVPIGTFLSVSVRRLEARMGLDVLLRSWRQVQHQLPSAHLLIAGEGRSRPELEALASALPRPEEVRLVGELSDDQLVRLYQAADCSVVPTRCLEGFGLVTLESMACGTPVIVTDEGGLPDGVVGLDPSLVVPADNSAALADRLLLAAQGKLPLSQDCRRHAEGYSWRKVAERHIELLTGLSRPRIVFIDHCAQLSGGEIAMSRIIEALDADSHVILAEDGPLRPLLEKAGATVHILALGERARSLRRSQLGTAALTSSVKAALYSLQVARVIRRLKPDLVQTNSLKADLYGGLAGHLARRPVVWHLHDRLAAEYLSKPARALLRTAARVLPKGIITNSESTRMTLGRIRTPVTVIPSPVAAKSLGTPPAHGGKLRVGVVGRLAPWKGQDLFLRSFARAFPDGNETAVIVGAALFGESTYAEYLRRLAAELGITDRVEFRGFQADVADEMASLDILVHSSLIPEPFGMVVVEAMAAGLAVAAADQGGPAEVIVDGRTGLLYSMGDEKSLAATLLRLAESEDFRQQLGSSATQVVARFRPEVIAAQVATFYEQLGLG